MKNSRFYYALITILLATILFGTIFYENLGLLETETKRDILYQTSTIDALLEGLYDGDTTFKELRKKGNIGIGTFDGLDGEMIGLDGEFYQIKADGVAYPVDETFETPFAVVTFFEPDDVTSLNEPFNYSRLEVYMDGLLPTENIFYAIKIEGVFEYVKARSVPRQSKPYPPLDEVIQHQSIFEFHKVEGTMVGFWTPEYMDGINVPGYHLHFITKDRNAGGHLLECKIENVIIEIDHTPDFYMALLESDDFYECQLAKDREKGMKVEK